MRTESGELMTVPLDSAAYRSQGFGWGYNGTGPMATASAISDWIGIDASDREARALIMERIAATTEAADLDADELRASMRAELGREPKLGQTVSTTQKLEQAAEQQDQHVGIEYDVLHMAGPDGKQWRMQFTDEGQMYARPLVSGNHYDTVAYMGKAAGYADMSDEDRVQLYRTLNQQMMFQPQPVTLSGMSTATAQTMHLHQVRMDGVERPTHERPYIHARGSLPQTDPDSLAELGAPTPGEPTLDDISNAAPPIPMTPEGADPQFAAGAPVPPPAPTATTLPPLSPLNDAPTVRAPEQEKLDDWLKGPTSQQLEALDKPAPLSPLHDTPLTPEELAVVRQLRAERIAEQSLGHRFP